MKRTLLFIAVALAVITSPVVRAEGSLSDAELANIQANCTTAQIALQHVQDADLSTRINRGHRYDTLVKLMTNFNGRVVQNKLNAPELITLTSNFQKALDAFIVEYTAYDDGLKSIIHMNCREQPTTFKDQLTALRVKRTALASRVAEFDNILNSYQTGVNDLMTTQGVTL